MKVLWIHWFKRTSNVVDFFKWITKNLMKEWIEMFAPEFEVWENINYKNWEKKLDKINVWDYDVVVWHSMWCRVSIEYITERKIKLKRLILVAPSIRWSWTKEVTEFYSVMKHGFKEIQSYVDEIIVLFSDDDTVIRTDWAREIAKELNAKLIEVTWYGHFNLEEVKIIEDLIRE